MRYNSHHARLGKRKKLVVIQPHETQICFLEQGKYTTYLIPKQSLGPLEKATRYRSSAAESG
jgi:hypothetical protein